MTKDASMYVCTCLNVLLSNTLVHPLVSFRYPKTLSSFRLSSIVGVFTLVHKNCTGSSISGRPCLPNYSNLATIEWNVVFCTRGSALLSILNRFDLAGVTYSRTFLLLNLRMSSMYAFNVCLQCMPSCIPQILHLS
jgi:hypothetical protein